MSKRDKLVLTTLIATLLVAFALAGAGWATTMSGDDAAKVGAPQPECVPYPYATCGCTIGGVKYIRACDDYCNGNCWSGWRCLGYLC